MRALMLLWIALFVVVAVFAQHVFQFDPEKVMSLFKTMPPLQQFVIGAGGFMALWLVGSAVWQADRIASQGKSLKDLQKRLDGVRQVAALTAITQSETEATLNHVAKSDPEETIAVIEKRLTDAEQRTDTQQSHNEGADLQQRLDEIRQRQHALRDRLGEVVEKRRIFEPAFGEIRDRQGQLERSLADLETDDDRNRLADRLKELEDSVTLSKLRLTALQEALLSLNRFEQDLAKGQAAVVSLQNPKTGTEALTRELHAQLGEFAKSLDSLETADNQPLTAHIETLSNGKREAEQKLARLQESVAVLEAVRSDFKDLMERQSHLSRSLAEIEMDATGKSLADKLKELDDFSMQVRTRFRTLEDSLMVLKRHQEEFGNSQTNLVRLTAADGGIKAVLHDVQALRDRLAAVVADLEMDDNQPLTAHVEALTKSKLETEKRIEHLSQCFAGLTSIQIDIGRLFTRLSAVVNGHADST